MFPNRKAKKEIMPWRKDALSHHKPKASRADRGDFLPKVVKELRSEADGKCQCGCGRADEETHHVMPRSRSGRGVKTNGMRVSSICNQRFHANEDELQHWIREFERKYGPYFWFDDIDWQEYERNHAAAQDAELERRQRAERVQPISNLITAAAGRNLKAPERRLIERLDDRELALFAQLLSEVARAEATTLPFGYGYFND